MKQRLSTLPPRRDNGAVRRFDRSSPMPQAAAVQPPPGRSRADSAGRPHEALLREAEAQRALAELFPHLQPEALRAIQALFPLAQRGAAASPESAAH
jgi:hypothetical protein